MKKHSKRLGSLALICTILSMVILSVPTDAAPKEPELIRFHVIANSDSAFDQGVKLQVRNAVIREAETMLQPAQSPAEAEKILKNNQAKLLQAANCVLREYHCPYKATADLGIRDFPAKAYGNQIFPAGKYHAFRIILGEGAGKNWWCVLYPPLCFVDIKEDTAVAVTTTTEAPTDHSSETIAADGELFQIKLRFKLLDEISELFPAKP